MELRDLKSESQRLIDDAQERAGEFYDMSRDFLRENQVLSLVGAGVLIGLIGFMLGRATKSD